MGEYEDLIAGLREPTRSLRHQIPAAWDGFLSLHEGAMGEGELSRGLKEGVALAISVVKGCEGCIAHHAKAAARAGARPAQIAELLSVALLMDGGSSSVHAPRAWDAFLHFDEERATGTTG
jgi:AhpD family alkylhydroperoxidase